MHAGLCPAEQYLNTFRYCFQVSLRQKETCFVCSPSTVWACPLPEITLLCERERAWSGGERKTCCCRDVLRLSSPGTTSISFSSPTPSCCWFPSCPLTLPGPHSRLWTPFCVLSVTLGEPLRSTSLQFTSRIQRRISTEPVVQSKINRLV